MSFELCYSIIAGYTLSNVLCEWENYRQVPKSIPAWKGAFIEPLACSVHAVDLGNIQFNDVVVVSGCGPLGLGMVAAAALKSPKLLIALDLFDWKVGLITCV